MSFRETSHEEIGELLQRLVSLAVSLPWKGYGSTIFLELGLLTPSLIDPNDQTGDSCIHIDWDWRVEQGRGIVFGSSNSGPLIRSGIESLRGVKIDSLELSGPVPELCIVFNNGFRLRSGSMLGGDPSWSIRVGRDQWLTCQNGAVGVSDGAATGMTSKDRVAAAHAQSTSARWRISLAKASDGKFCTNCKSFIRIDGNFHLLDFGVCTSDKSAHDGRAVSVEFGCEVFEAS